MKDAGVFLLLILSVVITSGVPVAPDLKSENEKVIEIHPVIQSGDGAQALNGELFKTVIRYFCSPEVLRQDSTTILYGTNSWTFPTQDVNLTLSYPTSNQEVRLHVGEYLISGYQVIMFTDGLKSTGRIAAGGLHSNHITLSFTVSQATVLSYEFWLYGAPSSRAVAWPFLPSHQIC